MQKIICLRNASPIVLLEVNQSVQDVIRTITKLEIVLESKWEIFNDCIKRDCRWGDDCNDCGDHYDDDVND